MIELTGGQLQRLAPKLTFDQLAIYPQYLNAAAARFLIAADARRLAAWLGQINHESACMTRLRESFHYTPEVLLRVFPKYFKTRAQAEWFVKAGQEAIANKVYGGRLGNVQPGDGWRFRGHGLIQLTGRENHFTAGLALGLPLEAEPGLGLLPENMFTIAAWFWADPLAPRARRMWPLNELSERHTVEGYREVTRAINGGENGFDDRLKRWREACEVLGLPAPKEA